MESVPDLPPENVPPPPHRAPDPQTLGRARPSAVRPTRREQGLAPRARLAGEPGECGVSTATCHGHAILTHVSAAQGIAGIHVHVSESEL